MESKVFTYCDIDEAVAPLKFKRLFHGGVGGVHFQLFQKPGITEGGKALVGSLKKHLKELRRADANGVGVAMAINTIEGKRRLGKNVTHINAVFVDDDSKTATPDKYRNCNCPPHAIVETSPGNLHSYWLIEGCPVADFKAVQGALARRFDTDPKVSDAGRAMRMPGTRNPKVKPPFPVTLQIAKNRPPPYKIAELLEGLQLNLEAPAQGARVLKPYGRTEVDSLETVEKLLGSISSDDRSTWLTVGMAIHDIEPTEAGRKTWTEWSQSSSKFDANDQQRTWQNFRQGQGITSRTLHFLAKGSSAKLDDMDMAEIFAHQFQHTLRYDKANDKWYMFGGVVWAEDKQAPYRCARDLVQRLTGGKKDGRFAQFRSHASQKTMVAQAQLLELLAVNPVREFDIRPDLLAVKNGVVDLRFGVFRAAMPQDYLSLQANVEYDPEAKCPLFMHFIRSVADGDDALRQFLCLVCGYTVTGGTDEQKFYVFVGAGGNGKGVLSHTLAYLLGSYAKPASPNLLSKAYHGNPNSPSPAVAALRGVRFILCNETSAGFKFDEAFVKQLAGGDELTARSNYGPQETFKPSGKLWITTNEMPNIRRNDRAMARRLICIPMTRSFEGEAVDVKLEEKLKAELPGILNWLVKGAVRHHKSGFGDLPKAVKEMTRQMLDQADTFQAWLDLRCSKKSGKYTESNVAYLSYQKFMAVHVGQSLNRIQFAKRLEEAGFEKVRRNDGMRWIGLAVNGKCETAKRAL